MITIIFGDGVCNSAIFCTCFVTRTLLHHFSLNSIENGFVFSDFEADCCSQLFTASLRNHHWRYHTLIHTQRERRRWIRSEMNFTAVATQFDLSLRFTSARFQMPFFRVVFEFGFCADFHHKCSAFELKAYDSLNAVCSTGPLHWL